MVTQQLKIANIALCGVIGKAFAGNANVYIGKDTDDAQLLAVRCYPLEAVSLESIREELGYLKSFDHPNIMSSIRALVSGMHLCIMSPLMDYGSVLDVVHSRYTFGLPEKAVIMIACSLLQAVTYLHDQNIVHRSIRCSHILLSSSGSIRLSGFRNCAVIPREHGTDRLYALSADLSENLLWLAPELLKQDLTGYGPKSDIYSVGITLCEMANGFPPFADMEKLQMLYEKERGTTPRLLDSTTLPDDDQSHEEQKRRLFSSGLHELTDLCLKSNPQQRPSAQQLLGHQLLKKQMKKCKHSLAALIPDAKLITPVASRSASSSTDAPADRDDSTGHGKWDF